MVYYLSLTKIPCNYFPCTLIVGNNIFCSSEQYYQYLKCMKVGCTDAANEVLKAKSAAAATQVLYPEKLDIWKEHSNEAMYKR